MSASTPQDGPEPVATPEPAAEDVEASDVAEDAPQRAARPPETSQRQVRVRRSPKVGVFLALGAAVGALGALVSVALTPVDPQVPTPQALGFLILLLAPVGALVGGTVAILIDRAGERTAKVVQAEHTRAGDPDEQQ